MKTRLDTRISYTESEMADSFQELLASSAGLPSIGPFDSVYREINCRQGRPDFIALRNRGNVILSGFPNSIGFVGPAILTTLKTNAPRTLSYLLNNIEFTESTIKRSLNQLMNWGYIERTNTGSYRLGHAAPRLKTELWVFELKLNNPKRAVFQAQQSGSYANYTIIVVPPGQEQNYLRYHLAIKRWGIGMATFDPLKRDFKILYRSTKARSVNAQHHIYALSQIGSL